MYVYICTSKSQTFTDVQCKQKSNVYFLHLDLESNETLMECHGRTMDGGEEGERGR